MKKWFFVFLFALFTGFSHATPLPARDVFQFEPKLVDPNTFTLNWTIKEGYFLYSDRISIEAVGDHSIQIGTLRFPPPDTKTDKHGRQYTVYRHKLSIPVPILAEHSEETLLNVHYQGCSDDGFCYPPETRQIRLGINQALELKQVQLEPEVIAAPKAIEENTAVNTPLFDNQHWPVILLTFYGFGLLLAFTPCVLPMVPVLSGIIVGHGHSITTRKAFFLSLSYVLSMALTYAVVGAITALLGSNLQVILQTPYAILPFSLLFVLLALSMFGFFDIHLPLSWQSKLNGISRSRSGGHYLSAMIMGFLSSLILSPCVTAPLLASLTYIAHSGNVLFGSLTLFILALGMGTPLLLIGTTAGRWLPAAGKWMNQVKNFFGVLLLGIAIYLASRLLPDFVSMLLWAALFIFCGLYLGALVKATTTTEKFNQGVGIILLMYGLLMLIGASMGNTNPLQPLHNSKTTQAEFSIYTQRVNTLLEAERFLEAHKGELVMIDFYADWCASCKEMEQGTLADSQVRTALARFKVLQVDLSNNDTESKLLMKQFHVIAPPVFMFIDRDGKIMSQETVVGELNASLFLERLERVQ